MTGLQAPQRQIKSNKEFQHVNSDQMRLILSDLTRQCMQSFLFLCAHARRQHVSLILLFFDASGHKQHPTFDHFTKVAPSLRCDDRTRP
jgi:hypothetical protein